MNKKNYKVNEIKQGGGPRERLLEKGPDALSDSELLAIVFMMGNRNENVLEMSNRVLKEYGSRSIANVRDVSQVMEMLGLGFAKASQLVAVFELGRRFFAEHSELMPTIKGPQDVYELLEPMRKVAKEEMRALYLNSRNKVIREQLISLGNENMNIVSPKEILHPAIELMSRGIIISHNHPSGDHDPSQEDLKFTEKLRKACEIMGVSLLDHVIISARGYTSLMELGYLK